MLVLNGGAAGVFLPVVGTDLKDVLDRAPYSFVLCLIFWMVGVLAAVFLGYWAREAQNAYESAHRSRRHALGVMILGRKDVAFLGIKPGQTVEDLLREAEDRQAGADKRWGRLMKFGLITVGCFVLGIVFAAMSLLRTIG